MGLLQKERVLTYPDTPKTILSQRSAYKLTAELPPMEYAPQQCFMKITCNLFPSLLLKIYISILHPSPLCLLLQIGKMYPKRTIYPQVVGACTIYVGNSAVNKKIVSGVTGQNSLRGVEGS